MDTQQKAFLEAIEKEPYNSTIRLIFADWLDEHDYYEDATEQRRKATPEWIEAEADKWLRSYAANLNYLWMLTLFDEIVSRSS